MKLEIHFEFRASLRKFQDLNFWDATKARSSSFCKITETYSHGNLRICQESQESWPSTN
jgi:hypothetical protein